MKIAIAHREGSFSEYWIEYCKENRFEYKIVNPYDTDVVQQVSDCDAFMWHHHHTNYKDALFAANLLFSLEQAGKVVFPNFNTGWHFDDKLGQKYLFEALGIPAAKAWAFYDKQTAYEWIERTSFPKVFKLRGGAGASNVKLAHNKSEAKKFVRQAFSKGFTQFRGSDYVKDSFIQLRARKKTWTSFLKSCGRLFIPNEFTRMHAPEKGYIYFQEFIPNDGFDIRVTVVGNKAIAFRRLVRKNDFRASASGYPIWDNEKMDNNVIDFSFKIADAMKIQTGSIDLVVDKNTSKPYLVEISYAYGFPKIAGSNYTDAPSGYWTKDLEFHKEDNFSPLYWMIEELIEKIK